MPFLPPNQQRQSTEGMLFSLSDSVTNLQQTYYIFHRIFNMSLHYLAKYECQKKMAAI